MQGTAGVNTMPLAIIVDDRTDVWGPGHEPQIVRATAFNYYENSARARQGIGAGMSARGVAESQRLLRFLQGIRGDHRHFWDSFLYPAAAALLEEGAPNAFWALEMRQLLCTNAYVSTTSHPPPAPLPSTAARSRAPSPAPAAAAPPPPPAAAAPPAPDMSLVPQDPRKLRREAAEAAAAAAAAAATVADAGASVPPGLPPSGEPPGPPARAAPKKGSLYATSSADAHAQSQADAPDDTTHLYSLDPPAGAASTTDMATGAQTVPIDLTESQDTQATVDDLPGPPPPPKAAVTAATEAAGEVDDDDEDLDWGADAEYADAAAADARPRTQVRVSLHINAIDLFVSRLTRAGQSMSKSQACKAS